LKCNGRHDEAKADQEQGSYGEQDQVGGPQCSRHGECLNNGGFVVGLTRRALPGGED
jgi:hypothetical protein